MKLINMPDNNVIRGFMKQNILFGMIIIVIIFTNLQHLPTNTIYELRTSVGSK
jgi:hypothetical protein